MAKLTGAAKAAFLARMAKGRKKAKPASSKRKGRTMSAAEKAAFVKRMAKARGE